MKIYLFFLPFALIIFFSYQSKSQQIQLLLPAELEKGSVTLQLYQQGTAKEIGSFTASKGAGEYGFTLAKNATAGQYEVVLEKYGILPFVYNGQNNILLKPQVEDMRQQRLIVEDEENEAFQYLIKNYSRYQQFQNQARNTLNQEWQSKGQKMAVANFMQNLILNKKGLNIRMDSLIQDFPSSFAAQHIGPNLKTAMPPSDTLDLASYYHQHYFDEWKVDAHTVDSPIFKEELKLYLTFFATKEGELYDGLSNIVYQPTIYSDEGIREEVVDILNTLLLEMKHPKAEEYIIFMANNFMEGCGGDNDTEEGINLAQRIQNTQVGVVLPDFSFAGFKSEKSYSLHKEVKKSPYTLLYFWKSTCEYCKAFSPNVEVFSEANQEKLNTIAVSLDDKLDHLEGYLKYIEITPERHRPANWLECHEKTGFGSEQLQQIYLQGTPCYILLNEKAEIVFRSTNFNGLKEHYNQFAGS